MKEKKVPLESRQKIVCLTPLPWPQGMHHFSEVIRHCNLNHFICIGGEIILFHIWIWTKGCSCLSNIAQRKTLLPEHLGLNIFSN